MGRGIAHSRRRVDVGAQVGEGNEDTSREMLRVKRLVQATLNTQVNLMSASMLAQQKKDEDADRLRRLAQDDEIADRANGPLCSRSLGSKLQAIV